MSSRFVVRSSTPRVFEGYEDFCWMEIGEEKLKKAVGDQALYYFQCSIGGELFEYSYPADKLEEAFISRKVRLRGEKTPRYSFYLEYPSGRIFRRLSFHNESEDVVCALNLERVGDSEQLTSSSRIRISECIAEAKLQDAMKEMQCNHLPKLVARTALWATRKEYDDCLKQGSPAKYPNIRRKYASEARGEANGIRLDDNSYPNAQMKASLKKQGINPIGYETCHIWKDSCHDQKYHTCFANLVLLPRAIAALSDHNDNIRDILKYRAYKLFGFWPDEEKPRPTDPPENYPKEEEWLND